MLGNLYDRALDGESCWVRHDDGEVRGLPVRRWLGGQHADGRFDRAVIDLCIGPGLIRQATTVRLWVSRPLRLKLLPSC